ncbi:hypothetical protein QJS10_CPA01g00107 [Acorus calamus]|uniref:Large ribosomal RNA subunit accumulation protein YCED homolog 2, chloroplastic n=1 Tax=Acorus calamus TaxID=4465 RepID=A0AAV9FM16_ACOCL|nr:hypothetical protein QJS10_CPA01g00107 [Acorus calamus]
MMAELLHPLSSKLSNPICSPFHHTSNTSGRRSHKHVTLPVAHQASSVVSFDGHELSKHPKKNHRSDVKRSRRLIKVSTASDGRRFNEWSSDYVLSLRDLQLEDIAKEGQGDTKVFITLTIQKHASFGFSVNGRILASFSQICSNCFSPYCKEINTTFDVWVLPTSRGDPTVQLPEIGGDDPSVIYVKPGADANLDALIQDTIRLTTSIKNTCSESCEKSPPRLHYIGGKRSYVDKRWSRLLEIKNSL